MSTRSDEAVRGRKIATLLYWLFLGYILIAGALSIIPQVFLEKP